MYYYLDKSKSYFNEIKDDWNYMTSILNKKDASPDIKMSLSLFCRITGVALIALGLYNFIFLANASFAFSILLAHDLIVTGLDSRPTITSQLKSLIVKKDPLERTILFKPVWEFCKPYLEKLPEKIKETTDNGTEKS